MGSYWLHKMWLLELPEASFSEHPSGVNVFTGFQTLSKSARQHFYRNFTLMQQKLSWKTSSLVRSKILGLFVNTMATDHVQLKGIPGTSSNTITLKNKKHSPKFLLRFRNLHKSFCILKKKKKSFIAEVFPKLLFVNTLRANHMYYRHNWEKYRELVQTQLS